MALKLRQKPSWRQGWKKPGFILYICPEEIVFLGFFQFQEYF
jgi:hypothetical protein